jgi:hypothetical protein
MRKRAPVSTHERLTREERPHSGSDRAFGALFAVIFTIGGLWPLFQGRSTRWWFLVVASAFLLLALFRPGALALLNRLWLRVGLVLHACISPIVMAMLYYTTVTPIALLLRLLGKDLLRLRFEPANPTYWIARQPPGPAPDTMPRQF